jgi:hypothetical protein
MNEDMVSKCINEMSKVNVSTVVVWGTTFFNDGQFYCQLVFGTYFMFYFFVSLGTLGSFACFGVARE